MASFIEKVKSFVGMETGATRIPEDKDDLLFPAKFDRALSQAERDNWKYGETIINLYLDAYRKNTTIRGAVDKLAGIIANNGWEFKVRTGFKEDKIEFNILRDLFEYPNGRDSFEHILFETAGRLKVVGEVFWFIIYKEINTETSRQLAEKIARELGLEVTDSNIQYFMATILAQGKIPVGFDIVDGAVNPLMDKYGNFTDENKAYEQTLNGQKATFRLDEILHFKLPNIAGGAHGLSPIESLLYAVNTDLWAQIYNKTIFENQGRPDAIYILKNVAAQEMARVRRRIEDRFTGAENAHKPLVVEAQVDGAIDVKVLGGKPQEMGFLDLRKYVRAEILTVLNTPPGKLGITEDVNKSNMVEQDKNYYQEEVSPMLNILSSTIDFFIQKRMKIKNYKYVFISKDFRSQKEQLELLDAEMDLGLRTLNDILDSRGFKKVKGGDLRLIQIPGGVVVYSKEREPFLVSREGVFQLTDAEGEKLIAQQFRAGTQTTQAGVSSNGNT